MMPKFELPMERAAAAGRTDITTPDSAREALDPCPHGRTAYCFDCDSGYDHDDVPDDMPLHVDPQEAHEREGEISVLGSRLRYEHVPVISWDATPAFEQGARAMAQHLWECYELVRMMEPVWADQHDVSHDPDLARRARAALEAAR